MPRYFIQPESDLLLLWVKHTYAMPSGVFRCVWRSEPPYPISEPFNLLSVIRHEQ